MSVSSTPDSLADPAACLAAALFLLASSAVWSFRLPLAERPLRGYVFGVTLCLLAAGLVVISSALFDTARFILSACLLGLGLVMMSVSLRVNDPTKRLRQKRIRLEERLQTIGRGIDAQLQALERLRDRVMADRHRELKQTELAAELLAGIDRARAAQQALESIRNAMDED